MHFLYLEGGEGRSEERSGGGWRSRTGGVVAITAAGGRRPPRSAPALVELLGWRTSTRKTVGGICSSAADQGGIRARTGEAADGIDERQATVAAVATIGVGAQSTLGGHDIFVRKICMTN